jgi:hypothetical protein
MDIVVPFSIRKRELGGQITEEAKKVIEKIKEKPDLAEALSAKGLPGRTTLHKVYATTPSGARRLLFFCRHAPPPPAPQPGDKPVDPPMPERWVLLFYRDKSDSIGKNLSAKNPDFAPQLERNLKMALDDLAVSTRENPLFEMF